MRDTIAVIVCLVLSGLAVAVSWWTCEQGRVPSVFVPSVLGVAGGIVIGWVMGNAKE